MTAIDDKHAQLKASGLDLGQPSGGESVCPDVVGHYRHYGGGSIYWHPDTGAHEVHGAILALWKSLGWELSWLGYPRSDEQPDGDGRRSRFQHGDIRWSPSTGAVDLPSHGWQAYWDYQPADHQKLIDDLKPQGWRVVSLGISANLTYASVWALTPGVDWNEIHGVSEQQLGTFLTSEAGSGRTIDQIAAISTPAGVRFAATTVAGPGPFGWAPRLTDGPVTEAGSLLNHNARAMRNHATLTSLSLYDHGSTSWAAAVWRHHDDQSPWNPDARPMTSQEDMDRSNVRNAHHGRPDGTAISSRHWATLHRDDDIGPWDSWAGLTRKALDDKFAEATKRGFGVRRIDVTGGSDPRYSVLFTKRLERLPRRLVVTGTPVPALAGLDDHIARYLRRSGIDAASMAVTKDARLIYARAFTWVGQRYPITQPTSLLRIGSESKVLTAIIIRRLIATGNLDASQPLKTLLPVAAPPGMTRNTAFDAITVEQLLTHQTALPANFAHTDGDVATAYGKTLPNISKAQQAAYMLCRTASTPSGGYRNTNYLVLGALVEQATGGRWVDALRTYVLQPLGLTRPTPTGSTLARRKPGEVWQHDRLLELAGSRMHADGRLVRTTYGNVNLEDVGDAIGGVTVPQCDLVRVLACLGPAAPATALQDVAASSVMFAGTTNSGVDFWTHNGGLSDTHAVMARRKDGIAWAVAYNTGEAPREPQPNYHDLIEAAAALPGHDLFPGVGLAKLV